MDIKKRYIYFLARLRHEVKKLGHGGKAYIGKNIGLKGGAFVGQICAKNPKKKASIDTQIAIGKFISGSDERFIEEGEQIVRYGCILASSKLTKTADAPPHPKSPDSSDSCQICNLHDKVIQRHYSVLAEFQNRELAIKLNEKLVELEKRNPAKLETVDAYLNGLLDALPSVQESSFQKNGTHRIKDPET